MNRMKTLALAVIALPIFGVAAFAQSAGPAAQQSTQQARMVTCNADAKAKSLAGDARKAFMADCLTDKSKAAAAPSNATTPTPPAQAAVRASVDVNHASADQLDALWGVGKVRAAAIIAGRPYKSLDDFHAKHVVPENVFARIQSQLTAR